MRITAEDTPLDGIAFVLDELFVNRVRDERDSFAGQSEVGA